MLAYQHDFIDFAIKQKALQFGEFTLKSGRKSPYFFNFGQFRSGLAMARLGEFYAAALQASQISYDMLFGPAYKGIPLVTTLAIALANECNLDMPYAFNRKEAKQHGEGGAIVGSRLVGNVLIVDDVITAGTAIREASTIIESHHATVAGVLIAVDRQERGDGERSAIEELKASGTAVASIVSLEHILEFVTDEPGFAAHLPAIRRYRATWGV